MIYLLTSDGYRDSINLNNYATDEESIEKLLRSEKLYFGFKIRNVKIDLVNMFVTFEQEWALENNTDDWDQCSYHLVAIQPFKE